MFDIATLRSRVKRGGVHVFAMAALAVGLVGWALASVGGGLFAGFADEPVQEVRCDLYPIALPYPLLADAAEGQVFSQMPRGTGAGNYSWLSWTGDPSAPTLATSLAMPGDARTYVDPDEPGDSRLDIGDWAQGGPGSMNAAQVRANLDALLGQDIVVPAYDATRGQGNGYDYRVAKFAVVRLQDYRLTGQGWLSFEFRGFRRCYNTPPVAHDQRVTTPEDTALPIVLTATDPQPDDALTYTVLEQPAHGALSGDAPNLVYTPEPNYNGPDRFTFRANDGIFDSAPATVHIEVTPVNDPPRFTSTPVLEAADGVAYAYLATAEDIDVGDVLTFSLVDAPAGMRIDAQTGLIAWTPTLEQVGTHTVVVVVTDLAGATDTQTYTLVVVRSNRPPEIVSTPVTEAVDGATYTYPVVAVDSDPGDVVRYSLSQAPAGMGIDPDTGVITWVPTAEQVGSHDVTVVATDLAGASDSQTYAVTVALSNRAPTIVSPPVHDAPEDAGYRHTVQATDPDIGDAPAYSLRHAPTGMRIDAASGEIVWDAAGWAGNNRLPNTLCMAGGEQSNSLAPAADVVVVVDESGSMSGEHAWLADFAAPLEAHLSTNGVGAGAVPNRYGLIGYEAAPRPIAMPPGPMGNYREFINATSALRISGGTEDGWRGIRHALFQYPLRTEAARNIILVTDEDRDNADSAITYASILVDLQAQKAVLNAVVNARFRCGDGSSALGMGQNRVGYKADGRGGYLTCANATALNGSGTTIADYVNLAIATGGAAWDIEVLRDGGLAAQSFSNALLKIKVQEILQQLPTRNQPDLYVHGLVAWQGMIHVDVGNRGLAAAGDAIALQVFADGALIDVVPMADLPAGALERVSLPWPPLGAEPARLSARLVVPDTVQECARDNNTLDAAWLRVRATDRGGLFGEQAFSVQPVDDNDAPVISSVAERRTGVGLRYAYRVQVADPDRGDAASFELATAPIGMRIDRLTGEIVWTPDAGQQGSHPVEVVVRDLAGATVRQSFVITVDPALQPPRFVSPPQLRAIQGTSYLYAPVVEADPSAQLRFDAFTAPDGLTMDLDDGEVRWEVPADFAGKRERVVLRVRDQFGNYDLQVYTLHGDLPNQAPRIVSNPGLSATIGSNYSYGPSVSDVNVLENFTWAGTLLPPGATVNAGTGALLWPGAAVAASRPAAMSTLNPFCYAQDVAVSPFAPRQLWANTRVRHVGQPLVGPLADTDFDGELTSRDLMAVVGVSQTDTTVGNRRIHAFNARNGQQLWSYNAQTPEWTVTPAMADLEGAGSPTILFVDSQRRLVALRGDGSLRWIGNTTIAASSLNYGAIVVSDLDGDGVAEILVGPAVYSHVGTLKWQFTVNASYNQGTPLPIDLDGDGRREVIFRGEIRDANGVLVNRLPSARTGTVYNAFYAPVDIAGSARPHIAVSEYTSGGRRLSLVDPAGNAVWTQNAMPANGPVVVADFSGDGAPDLFVPAMNRLYSATGDLLWSSASNGNSENFRAAVAGDFDRDGELDALVVNSNTSSLNLIAGRTGAVTARLPMSLSFGTHVPVMVDLDGDGQSTLFVGDSAALRAYRSTGVPWHTAARVVHQQPFALDQVRGDLRLSPVDPGRTPAAGFVLGTRQPVAVATRYLPDLRVSAPYGVESAGVLRLSVDVLNRGTGPSAAAEVEIYRGDVGGDLVGRVAVPALGPGESARVELATSRAEVGEGEVTALAIAAVGDNECALGNNAASGRTASLRVADYGGLTAEQFWVFAVNERMLAPTFAGTAPNRGTENALYRHQAQATSPHDGDVLLYQLSNAPEGASVDPRTGEVLWTPRWGQTGNASFSLQARSLNGLIATQSWTVTVVASTLPNQLPDIVSDPVTAATVNQAYRYDVRAVDPDGQAITYALAAGPSGMRIDAQTGTLLWVPQTAPATPVDVRVTATDERGGRDEQSFQVRVYATPNRAPVISSVPVLSLPLGQGFEYRLLVTDPDGDPLTYLWPTLPQGATLAAVDTVIWTPGAAQVGENAFVVEVRDDRGGWARQSFTVFVNDASVNTAPRIVSTPNPRAAVGSAYAYTVGAQDDEGDALGFSLIERPQGMTIDAATGAIAWTPVASQLGTHTVEVQVTDGRGGVARQRYSVQVLEQGSGGNRAPAILSTPASNAKIGYAYRYDLHATDADGDLLAYSLTQAPAGMSIDAATGRIDFTPTQPGDVPVRVRVSDGALWTEQGYVLTVADALPLGVEIQLPAGGLVGQGESFEVRIVASNAASQLVATLLLDGQPVVLGPDLSVVLEGGGIGEHTLVATVSDGYEVVSATSTYVVLDPSSQDGPVVTLTNPVEADVVTAPVEVLGSVADSDLAGWTLSVLDRDGSSSSVLASGTDAISGPLGTLDPTLLQNGQYVVVLRAWDALGHESRVFANVTVDGEMKLGHFSMSFEDATVPLMGMPISVTRTYDSRRSGRSLDFGHGWSVDVQSMRIHESRTIGNGWSMRQEGGGFFPSWCVRADGDPIVSVTLPDGDVQRFRARAMPECQILIPSIDVRLVFEALPGTYSKLEQTSYGSLRVSGGVLLDLGEFEAADPDSYRLTTQDGTRYDLVQGVGIRKVTDLSGNTLTYGRDGVVHSSGVGIQFLRDSLGRITALRLPDGGFVDYEYDAAGDLTAVVDQVGNVSRFGYLQGRYAHYLQDIFDACGVRAARNEYDADGRLVAQVDADGKRIEFSLDVTGRTQTVKNRLGETSVFVFDDNGRVLQETNALGETVLRTYDASGNTLTETNAEGETVRRVYDAAGNKLRETDHLGNATAWTYDNRGRILTQTNPTGLVTANNQYDLRSGNLLSTVDGNGASTSLVYGSRGELLEMRLPEGATTTYAYNTRGDKVFERGPDGMEISRQFDSGGRPVVVARTFVDGNGQRRTLTTRHVYDAKGRLIETIDPQGRSTYTEYNAIDKETARVDALGRRTEMVYDNRGNLLQTRHPDGTVESTVYDEENRAIAKIDRGGRSTLYVHDAAGRVVETHHPDGAIERTQYDRAGRVVASIDGRGNTTTFVYDDAGRLVSTTNALNRTTTMTYRADGAKVSTRDALGRTTKFEYDGAGRLTATLHPDNTPTNDADAPRIRTTYDALGRKTSTIDEAGRTTRFEYDAASRLVAVVDPLDQRTEYRYDGRGEKIAQIDALGRTTRWEYDDSGHVVARILPLGQRETMEYDAAGQMIARVDFKGQRTTYRYDAAGRELEVRHADGSGVVTTYTPSGQVATRTDAAGTTTHQYDARDRLVAVSHPDGVGITYAYDAAGNRTRMTTAQQDIAYAYDAMNRLASVTQSGRTTGYTYNDVGSRLRATMPNGTRTDYAYDVRNRLQRMTHYSATGSVLLDQVYTVEASGLRTQIVESGAGTRTTVYTYDGLKRLVREQVTDTTRGHRTSSWTYDAVGNRTTEARTKSGATLTTLYSYDDNDRLQHEIVSDGSTVVYDYDDNGSLTGKRDANGFSVYGYDGGNRLVSAITPSANIGYRYDADGIRQSQTVNGVVTRFVVDPTAKYAQVLEERSGGDDVLYLLGDDRIARTQGGATHYLHVDGLGSTRALSTSAGQASDRWWYEAFGEVESSTGTSANTFLFAGEQLDPNLGYYYLRARYMDPSNGRFTQMDVFSGFSSDPVSLHKYLYANANPVVYVDPSGHFAIAMQGFFISSISIAAIITVAKVVVVIIVGVGVALLMADVISNIIQDAWMASSNAQTAAQEAQRQAEYDVMKRLSDNPPPDPGGKCGPLSRAIHHAAAVITRYKAWDAKWFPGRHTQKISDWENRLKNLKDEHNRKCT